MKLTAEQKQLFHECVDLALDILIEIENIPTPDGFDYKELQQAKDYLTELLVGKVISKEAFDRKLSHEECVELTK